MPRPLGPEGWAERPFGFVLLTSLSDHKTKLVLVLDHLVPAAPQRVIRFHMEGALESPYALLLMHREAEGGEAKRGFRQGWLLLILGSGSEAIRRY